MAACVPGPCHGALIIMQLAGTCCRTQRNCSRWNDTEVYVQVGRTLNLSKEQRFLLLSARDYLVDKYDKCAPNVPIDVGRTVCQNSLHRFVRASALCPIPAVAPITIAACERALACWAQAQLLFRALRAT